MFSPWTRRLPTVSGSVGVTVHPAAWESDDGSVGAGESALGPVRASAVGWSVRALVTLLRLTGLSGGRGWCPLLHAGALYAIASVSCVFMVMFEYTYGRMLTMAGVHWIRAIVLTNYLGFSILLPWLTLTANFVCGRRRYAALLSRLFPLLQDIAEFAELREKNEDKTRSRPTAWHLWLLVVLISLPTLSFTFSEGAASIVCDSNYMPMVLSCTVNRVLLVLAAVVMVVFLLIPLKYLLAAGLLRSGQRALNSALAAAVAGRDGADSSRRLRRAARLLRRLSVCLSDLTSAAAAELVPAMLYGVLTQILLLVAVLDQFAGSGDLVGVVLLASYFCSALVTLFGPCEAGERLLVELGRCRELLLRLEEARPELAPRAERLQRQVAVDLDSAGDLSLYRLRRSTLLSIWSAIITYIIVMLQFLDAKRSLGEMEAFDLENFTMTDY